MIKTKQILIALAVIGANMLHDMPVNTSLAAEVDYTIIQGSNSYDSATAGGTYSDTIKGNPNSISGLSSTRYSDNEVIIRNGTYAHPQTAVAGAYTETSDDTKNNTVSIYGGTIKADILGANSTNGAVSGNKVNIYGGTLGEGSGIAIYGGYSDYNNATGNLIYIEGGTFASGTYICGGYICYSGNVGGDNSEDGNTVDVKGVTLGSGAIYGGCSAKGNVANNKVNITDGTFGTQIYGGYNSKGNAVNNKVNITDGTFTKTIYGGSAIDDSATVLVKNNSVTITTGTFNGDVFGGYCNKVGEVVGNSVTINDGNFINKNVYGGWSRLGTVTENEVTIKSGTFTGTSIYGGYILSTSSVAPGSATGNKVNIEGGNFSGNYKLYGGYIFDDVGGTSTGNTLNLKIKMGGKAAEVGCFQIMNFTLPNDIADGQTMLKTTNMKFDPTNTTINVDASAATLNDSDVITLIAYDSKTGNWTQGTITGGPAGWVISDTGNSIIFSLPGAGGGNEDQQKAPVEGIAAAVQMVNQSADLASGQGMASLVANTAGGATDTFGAMSAGSSKYKTGSHVDVDGWGVLVGAGKTKEWKDGSATTYGLFFEYGKGDFDTYNGNVHGDGNSENKGVGIMARHKLTNNTYYEGNIRYGKQETEWGQSDIGSYDTDSRYYGISVGMGHIFPAGKNEIDVYGRYTYGHVGACDATVGTSEYHFDSVKSHRVRVGGKYNFKLKDSNAKPYVGLAWEREFKGESKASIAGVGEAPAPSMKGNTGILEVGCDWKVSKKWTVGLGANAYMGKRKGWDGMARVFYNF